MKNHTALKWIKPSKYSLKIISLRTGRANASMLDLIKVDEFMVNKCPSIKWEA